jgi:hypothetical protein
MAQCSMPPELSLGSLCHYHASSSPISYMGCHCLWMDAAGCALGHCAVGQGGLHTITTAEESTLRCIADAMCAEPGEARHQQQRKGTASALLCWCDQGSCCCSSAHCILERTRKGVSLPLVLPAVAAGLRGSAVTYGRGVGTALGQPPPCPQTAARAPRRGDHPPVLLTTAAAATAAPTAAKSQRQRGIAACCCT